MSAAKSKNTYLGVKYRRIASRRGPMKAIVAVEHAMLVAIWSPHEPVRTSQRRGHVKALCDVIDVVHEHPPRTRPR
jgi:transcriptional regulator of NAD metabolism